MSAEQLGRGADGAWRFRMSEPIPPYLIALACGEHRLRAHLRSRGRVGRAVAAARPPAHEFADTEAMIQAAEALFGPYRWGRYDLIILPPSFPFGGMENPRLTFATPTVLAGDKSLVSLVAHELAHSWSGNLVTNATWRDFWLNEGFTTYCEQRIMEQVFGPERSQLEKQLAMRRAASRSWATWRTGRRCCTSSWAASTPTTPSPGVPYEKGSLFLQRLEAAVRARRASTLSCAATSTPTPSAASPPTSSSPTCSRTCWPAIPAQTAASLDLDRWLRQARAARRCARAPAARRWRRWTPSGSASWPGRRPASWTPGLGHPAVAALHPGLARRHPARRGWPSWTPPSRFTTQRQQRDPGRLAAAGHQARLPPRRRPAGGVPAERGPPQVPEAAVHRAGQDRGGTPARPGHLRQGAPALPRGGHRHDRQDPGLA